MTDPWVPSPFHPAPIASVGGAGVGTLGGPLVTLDATGAERVVIDDGAGNADVPGTLTVGGHLAPPWSAATPPALVSGTAAQNTSGRTWWMTLPVTLSPTTTAAAEVAYGVGPTSSPPTAATVEAPSGVAVTYQAAITAVVPPGWWILATATNATLGTPSAVTF